MEHFEEYPKSYLSLISHVVKSRQFISFAVFDLSEINERLCIKFCFKLGTNATETYAMIKTAFGDDPLSRFVTFEWFKRFKDGQQSRNEFGSNSFLISVKIS